MREARPPPGRVRAGAPAAPARSGLQLRACECDASGRLRPLAVVSPLNLGVFSTERQGRSGSALPCPSSCPSSCPAASVSILQWLFEATALGGDLLNSGSNWVWGGGRHQGSIQETKEEGCLWKGRCQGLQQVRAADGGRRRDTCRVCFGGKAKRTSDHQGRAGKRGDEGPGLRHDISLLEWEPRKAAQSPPSLPSRPSDYNSQHRSLRPREGEKKKFGPNIPGMRFLLALGAGLPGRGGRAGQPGGGRRSRTQGALGPAGAPAWPNHYSGKPSPACGAGRNFPGKSRTRRSAVSRTGGRRRGHQAPPRLEGVPGPKESLLEGQGEPLGALCGLEWGIRGGKGSWKERTVGRGARTVTCA